LKEESPDMFLILITLLDENRTQIDFQNNFWLLLDVTRQDIKIKLRSHNTIYCLIFHWIFPCDTILAKIIKNHFCAQTRKTHIVWLQKSKVVLKNNQIKIFKKRWIKFDILLKYCKCKLQSWRYK
jgi:hypothetical protein